MLFMIIERFKKGQAPAVYRRFHEKGRMAPEEVQYHASWVDLEFNRCFQVMEAQSATQVWEWASNWGDLVDFEIIPVRTSAEASAEIAPLL